MAGLEATDQSETKTTQHNVEKLSLYQLSIINHHASTIYIEEIDMT